jgi:uncharacterized delta-60 repeat protein
MLAWPLVIFLLLPALTRAETAVQAWVQRYNGTGNNDDRATAMAVDSSNNVMVTGYSLGINYYYGYATIKYSSTGVPIWTNRYSAPGSDDDEALAMAVDSSNNVIVTGYSWARSPGCDYSTIKYSSAGAPLWTNRYNLPGGVIAKASAVAVDGSNSVIVTGYVQNGANDDYATIKYSSAGLPLWTNRYNGPGNGDDHATAMAVDGSNNVIVTGYSPGSSNNDYATIKYSSTGLPLWTNRYNGAANYNDAACSVAVDHGGNVIVTGHSYIQPLFEDYATIKYSSAGVPLWTNSYHKPGAWSSYPSAVAVDGSNNVIVTGGYSSRDPYNDDYATIKYSSAGVPLWTNTYNRPGIGDDHAYAMALDQNNNIIVTGGSADSKGNFDYVTIKYSSAGMPLWTNRYNGPATGGDCSQAVAVDCSGNVVVTGYSDSGGGNYDFTTIKYICVPEPVMTSLQPTNGTFQLRVDGVLQPGTLVIEAATNLSTPNWAGVFTNTTPTNVLFYTDPEASNGPARFYRAFQFP